MKIFQLPDVTNDTKTRFGIIKAIKDGKVFIYPTDTVYGLGCDASNTDAVRRIRSIKGSASPFSVIAPSKEWILDNLEVRYPEYLDRLPGPYTLIMKVRKKVVSPEVSMESLGVRIPEHPLTEVIQETGLPFVTTSANMSGETPVWSTHGIPAHIEKKVDIAVNGGILNKRPSTIFDLRGKRPRKIR